ncbi:DegT/DnrJ/EryC1/StrS family aminotransferase [Salinimicrobium sp. TIG7-5_MAKvit]|uniref:DegT/DnrJ/EryC1/StrS family aminotransferase n=1 Tax=Salinimicrobium sp. TIG7-5_MAKvit TaxID=3121289 RepID=UPI003C6DE57B
MIPVTKAFFPPIEKYQSQLQRIWKNQWLTNRGELVHELESELRDYLNISNITLTTNGTLPLQMALNILGGQGEIITTPFSYVATVSTIVWEHCKPIFVDIHPEYLTIDENLIEAAITPKTTAILATHVFGNPCNVEVIEEIAKKHQLKVIYDAAHCFGVTYKRESIFNYGDVSTCSFHATKLFHTAEGGAFICKNKSLNHKLFYSHKFGHNGPLDFYGVGINAKMSELQAAMGLSVFPYLGEIIDKRKKIVNWYNNYLDASKFQKLKIRQHTEWNYSYYPIILENEEELLRIEKILNTEKIYPRRYFYPSLNLLDYVEYRKKEVSESIASRILCLPLYVEIEKETIIRIAKLMNT